MLTYHMNLCTVSENSQVLKPIHELAELKAPFISQSPGAGEKNVKVLPEIIMRQIDKELFVNIFMTWLE